MCNWRWASFRRAAASCQILTTASFDGSDEAPGVAGLGLMSGMVRKLDDTAAKVPHIGWSHVD